MGKLITVVIPTFNRSELTDRAIDSVASTRADLVEIIVVDDCSSPHYRAESPTNSSGIAIEVHRTLHNGGPGLARKMAVGKSNCDIIAFLDSDDVFDAAWIDCGLDEILGVDSAHRNFTIVASKAENGTLINRACLDILRFVPESSRIVMARLAAVMFNPFYTSSIMVSKKLCVFDESLRYCEDYYTNAMAIFRAKRIVVLPRHGAVISRKPGSSGGLSGMKRKMFLGEMQVRRAMLTSTHVPLMYKVLVPIGMIYQLARTALKMLIG